MSPTSNLMRASSVQGGWKNTPKPCVIGNFDPDAGFMILYLRALFRLSSFCAICSL